ncbi:MAG: hypothetical protein R3246_15360, partial [Acidimicrobiia bacterium]|nr:hypothetical protein [Acidimicrobiia bacterium]
MTVTDDTVGVVARVPALGTHDGDALLEPGETWVYRAMGTALDLSAPAPPGVTVVPGCGDRRPTYENVGTVAVDGRDYDSDPSHYCNPKVEKALLTVVKDSLPEDDSEFEFEIGPAGGPVRTFTLRDPSANTRVFDLDPGRWRVAEDLLNLPAGRWFFRGGTCREANSPGEVVIVDSGDYAEAVLAIEAGDEWRCVFSNREWARVEIFKEARTDHPLTDPDVEFPFRTDIPEGPADFMLADGESIVFDMVPEGTHRVVERLGAMPSRWFLTGIGCNRPAGHGYAVDVNTGLLRLELRWGEEIICRFVNEEGFLDIEKSINGHDADQMPGPTILVGEPIRFDFVVTNRGPEPVTGIAVVDSVLGPVACPKTALDPGESMTCTVHAVAMPGEHKNVGTATGWLDGEP